MGAFTSTRLQCWHDVTFGRSGNIMSVDLSGDVLAIFCWRGTGHGDVLDLSVI